MLAEVPLRYDAVVIGNYFEGLDVGFTVPPQTRALSANNRWRQNKTAIENHGLLDSHGDDFD